MYTSYTNFSFGGTLFNLREYVPVFLIGAVVVMVVVHTPRVLLATHVVSDVETVADRILVMKDGELVADDSPEKLAN